MKKTLLLAAMTVLGFGLAHADFSQGAGHFYMVQNKATKRYINLIHDQGNALSQDFHAIRLENDGEQHTEPGTLIYISSGYNLSAQGTSVKDITGYSVNIKQNGTGDKNEAVYNAWVTAGFLFFKQDVYFQDEAGKGFDKAGTGDADDCRWYIKPVDTGNGGDCYFGVSPKQSDYLDGYYYTTLRASFAYKLSQGVDAFTVVGGKLNELPHDNVVPANTPVILRCKSAHASDNRLYPQAIGGKYTAESTVTSSLVSGTKYSYFKTSVVNAKVGENIPRHRDRRANRLGRRLFRRSLFRLFSGLLHCRIDNILGLDGLFHGSISPFGSALLRHVSALHELLHQVDQPGIVGPIVHFDVPLASHGSKVNDIGAPGNPGILGLHTENLGYRLRKRHTAFPTLVVAESKRRHDLNPLYLICVGVILPLMAVKVHVMSASSAIRS